MRIRNTPLMQYRNYGFCIVLLLAVITPIFPYPASGLESGRLTHLEPTGIETSRTFNAAVTLSGQENITGIVNGQKTATGTVRKDNRASIEQIKSSRTRFILIACFFTFGMAILFCTAFRNILLAKEIKKRKAQEEQLRLQALVLDQIQDRVMVTDMEGNITYVNEAELSSMGYPREEIIGKRFEVCADDQNGGTTQKEIIRTTRNQGSWHGEVVSLAKDGRVIITEYRTQLVRNNAGVPIAMAGINVDITQRKQMEGALRESQRSLMEIIDFLPDATFVIDKAGKVTAWNRAIEKMTGIKAEGMVGKGNYEYAIPFYGERRPILIDMLLSPDGESFTEYHGLIQHQGNVLSAEVFVPKIYEGKGAHLLTNASVLCNADGDITGAIESIHDITDRKKAEEALRESEHRFKELSDLLPEAVFETDSKMRLTFTNRKAFNLFGFTEEDLKDGPCCLNMISPEDRGRALENIRKRMASFDNGSSEYRALRKDGSTFPILISATAIYRNGKPAGIRGIIMDITERKKAEETQRESERMIGSILSTTPVGIGLTVDSKIKWVNEAWMEIFGFKQENEYMGQPVRMLYSNDDSYEESRGRIYAILENARVARIEAFMARQDGTPFQAQISVAPLDPSNLQKGTISTISDISEWIKMEQSLRESEEKYRLAMNATSDGLWDWDIATGEVYYSPAWTYILGEEVGSHISSWQSRMHPDERDTVLQSFSNHLEGRSDSWSHEHRLRQSTGKWKWVLGRGSVISRNPEGKALRMVGTICDIEDRKRLESQLIQAQKMEAIGTLAGGIAHDFNNILASISGYTELFIMKERRQDNYLLQVMNACERAKNLVNQILLFSRQREGEKKPVDAKIIVKEALKLLRASIPSTIKINPSVSPDASMVMADPTHIHQIVMNLCTNAAHAMRENGGLMEVSISNILISDDMTLGNPDLQTGPYVHLRVADNGQGIAPQIMDKIFDPFFTTKKQGEGTGLGLSVVYGIVKSYEGEIRVESKIGRGSTFDIYLPRLIVENMIEGKQSDVSPHRGNECILVIDDEKDLVIAMQNYLAALGYDVVTSTDGLDALGIFRKDPRRYDLIITDMTMPQMTGLRLSREILSVRPEIPIILCTGYHESITEAEAKRHGIREFVMKPIRLSEYSRLIRKSLDS